MPRTDRGKPKYVETNLLQCHFVLHKSNIDSPETETVPPRWNVGNWPSEPWHGPRVKQESVAECSGLVCTRAR